MPAWVERTLTLGVMPMEEDAVASSTLRHFVAVIISYMRFVEARSIWLSRRFHSSSLKWISLG